MSRGQKAIEHAKAKLRSGTEYLLLTDTDLGDAGVTELAGALQSNNTVRVMGVGFNGIGDAGMIKLATALKTNKSIVQFSAQGNNIGPIGATELAAALRTNKSLESVLLWNNHIGDVGAAELAAAIQARGSFVTLNLSGNGISDVGAAKLLAAIKTVSIPKTDAILHVGDGINEKIMEQIDHVLRSSNVDSDVKVEAGEGEAAESDASGSVIGLESVTTGHDDLVASRGKALAWCQENGVPSVAFLKDVEMEQDLIAALKLKVGPAKKLARNLRGYIPNEEQAGGGAAGENFTPEPDSASASAAVKRRRRT